MNARKLLLNRIGKPSAITGAIVVVLVTVGSATAFADLIYNGSFEIPDMPEPGMNGGTPAGWSGGLYVFRKPWYPSYWPDPEDGEQYVDIGDSEVYSFTQAVTVTIPGDYLLSWYDNAYPGSEYFYYVSIGDRRNLYSSPSAFSWILRALDLELGTGVYTLKFEAAAFSGSDTLIDNVSLTLVSAVPESDTLGLLTLSLTCLALLGTRLRK